jgi:hypothetical protein
MACSILYIIEKLLERRCLKWARIAHSEFETQVMAKRRAGSQIVSLTPDHKKSGIDPIYLAEDNVPHTVGKSYNFALDHISIRDLLEKLWGSKVAGVPVGAISGLSFRSPGREKPYGCGLCGQPQSIL